MTAAARVARAHSLAGSTPVVLFASSSGMGGMEAHMIQVARGLTARGVVVAAICSSRADLRPLREGLAAAGATVHALETRDGTIIGVARRLRTLAATIALYPGCVVHMHYGGYTGGELVQFAARLAGASAIVRTEHVPPVPPITKRGALLVRLRDRFLAKVICVSEQNRTEHLRVLGRDPGRCLVVHNGVDVGTLTPAIETDGALAEFGFPPDTQVIGTVARLVERRKAISDFLEMAARVRVVAPRARFLIIGDGVLRRELEAQARALGIADVVVFAGDRTDVPRLLREMTVFVMPSLYEGCQYALLEAMAIGRPVVSTPAGVAPAVVRDRETGLLVPFGDPVALARAVGELLADPAWAARLGAVARQTIVAGFSLEAMTEQLTRVYEDAASRI